MNSISDPTILGWTVREPDKALIVQSKYTIIVAGVSSEAVRTQVYLPGASLADLPASVTGVIGLVWTPDVLAAQQTAAEAAEAARLASFNTALEQLGQMKALAEANGQPGLVASLQGQIDQLTAARDAGQPFEG